MKIKGLSHLVAALILASSSGCFTFPKKEFPEKKYYVLEVQRDAPTLPVKNGLVLTIRNLKMSPPYNQNEFIYQKAPSEFAADFYNEFLTQPNMMLTEQLRRWLFAAGLFQNTVLSNSYVAATHVLEGNIEKLYGDYRDPNVLHACSEMQFTLIDDTRIKSPVIFQQGYGRNIPISSKDPVELVKGWNQGLREIFAELESDLSKLRL